MSKADEMNIEEAKKILERVNNAKRFDGLYTSIGIILEAIETVLKELELKDKVIDWLVEEIHSIVNLGEFIDNNINKLDTKEEIKEWCINKVKLQSNKQSQ